MVEHNDGFSNKTPPFYIRKDWVIQYRQSSGIECKEANEIH